MHVGTAFLINKFRTWAKLEYTWFRWLRLLLHWNADAVEPCTPDS